MIHAILYKKDGTSRPLGILNWVGIFAILLILYSAFAKTDFTGPWWSWTWEGVHHFEDYLVLPSVALFMLTTQKVKSWTALYASGVVMSVHEIFWYVCAVIMTKVQGAPNVFEIFGTLIQFLEILGFGSYLIFTKKHPWKYLLLMAGVYAAWFAMGFHIRSGYAGPTTYYFDPATNITEIASWVIAGIAFCALERDNIKDLDSRINVFLNLVISKIPGATPHESHHLGTNSEVKGEEAFRARRSRHRDCGGVHPDHLRPGSGDHQPLHGDHDDMAGGCGTYHPTGSAGLRWHRYPPRNLRQGQNEPRREGNPR